MTRLAALVLVGSLGSGCSVNPATGRLQFNSVSPEEEAVLGRELDAEVRAGIGLYPDPELSAYVTRVGTSVAAASERSEVTWTFRVLDDPAVNAFALPGGYVYTARGILAHLQSEAEVAATVAHEIAHVAARHGASQYSRARAAARGVGVLRVVDPHMQHIGALAAGGVQLRLLRHSRDHELEADSLGLRYLQAAGYGGPALVDVLSMLASLGGEQPPPWLSTHPDPDLRVARLQRAGLTGSDGIPDPDYLSRLDGLAFGPDPRDGYFGGRRYAHPRGGFAVTLPEAWVAARDDGLVVVTSPDDAVVIVVALSGHEHAPAASKAFFGAGGLTAGASEKIRVNEFEAISTPFIVVEGAAQLTGVASFVQVDERVVMYIAFGARERWATHGEATAASFASLTRPTAQEQAIQPARIAIVTLEAPTTLARMVGTDDPVLLQSVLALNRVDEDTVLAAGRGVKLIRGDLAKVASVPHGDDGPSMAGGAARALATIARGGRYTW